MMEQLALAAQGQNKPSSACDCDPSAQMARSHFYARVISSVKEEINEKKKKKRVQGQKRADSTTRVGQN